MNRTERLYAITEELRAAGRAGRTSRWLARRFEVSTRTVKRDVAALQQVGVPVLAEPGAGGGYRLVAAAPLPPVSLTAAEATAIALALAAAPDLPFTPDGRAALTKVLAAMPADERRRARDIGRRLWVRPADHRGRPAVARVLDEALRTRRVTVLDYIDGAGRATRRPVEPMAFAHDRGRWYLLAWCRTRTGGRWFRLDRVTRATVTGEVAPARDLRAVFGDPPDDARPLRLPGAGISSRRPSG